MAQVERDSLVIHCDFSETSKIQENIKKGEAEIELFKSKLKSANPGTLIGEEIQFPKADSHASYIITKERPLTLKHVKFLDGWTAPAEVRGLTLSQAKRLVDHQKRIEALFNTGGI